MTLLSALGSETTMVLSSYCQGSLISTPPFMHEKKNALRKYPFYTTIANWHITKHTENKYIYKNVFN